MSARRSRRAMHLATPLEAYRQLETAMVYLEGSALVVAVEGIGYDALAKETARYTADRLLQADVQLLRAAVDAMQDALQAGAQ